MSKFICVNSDCSEVNKPVEVNTMNWPYIKQSERIEQMRCGVCGNKMEAQDFKSSADNTLYCKFNSLDDDSKKKILKKRAALAYKREGGAEHKRFKIQETLKKFRQ